MGEMIEYKEALELVSKHAPGPGKAEPVPLGNALGRVLAEEAVSDVDLPPFDKSAMDGFAVRAADVETAPVDLQVVMDVPAGGMPTGPLGPGQAASIMTGAPVPEGADAVVQVEWTSGFGRESVEIQKSVPAGKNVSPRAEILKKGQVVLEKGSAVGIEEISLLAAVGCDPVPVYERPTIGVLSTGDELVDAREIPGPGQIRNTNSPTMLSFFRRLGLDPVNLGNAPDDPQALYAAVERGLALDCLVLSGGVSAGSYDFVEDILARLNVVVHTRRVAMKPGKPTVFGTLGNKMIFGLPGNPVSTLVTGRVLVEPALRKRMGYRAFGPRVIKAVLRKEIKKKPDRLWFVNGRIDIDGAVTVEAHKSKGSADLVSPARSDCLIVAPKGVQVLEAGSEVDVVVWDRCTRIVA